ncbi:SusD/RagB family nutrient-binding outer membrane lipoprotein [Marinoscillum furvescens]|uniref:SusD-like starch-binding protein associating with outer membrane n=1 Tax=Marinoscillum furvescens DSM 4134 TaxID=1122208 RepID=A0A3D9L978_MARFU|nr:SusD/RagB family nutrient-binding outer membrane lipoprotein [Marinoscillum furvescens]REE02027.1 SusD-like starch-binding protein associating with outer membrane [Marinoscillum furvescens DSM 4134]
MNSINKNIIKSILILSMSTFGWSCSDEVLNEIDTDPNALNPQQVLPVNVWVAASERLVTNVMGNTSAVAAATFSELLSNSTNNGYRADFTATPTWVQMYYTLNDFEQIITRAEANESWNFAGCAKVLKAYTLAVATDLFGDIPYSETGKPTQIQNPKVDTQEAIYAEVLALLEGGIADLGKGAEDDFAGVDQFYGGNIGLWLKTAYGLKARYLNRLSNRSDHDDQIIAALASAYQSNDDNLVFSGYSENNRNPIGNLNADLVVHSTFVNTLLQFENGDSVTDPRAEIWMTLHDNTYKGAIGFAESGGLYNDFSAPKAPFFGPAAPMPLLTFSELKFIEAETLLRQGNTVASNDAYEAAVTASMNSFGVDAAAIATFAAASEVFPGASALALEDIMRQKFLSFFVYQGIEAYNDIRRTGIPANQEEQPVKFPLPNSEADINSNLEGQTFTSLTNADKVWWAK